ncbi:hypothetical protein [Aliterella atlantica]|uniref:hypothetical protein n=1 Tax=Aliterella atlantica TaxID=1827278 RepID=UPI00069741DF|nr:hypothetical protein [Aliterella atlantica]
MKADLEKIAAALKKLESMNNSPQQQPVKSQPIPSPIVPEAKDSARSASQAIPPLSVPPNQRKTPTLPAFTAQGEPKPTPEPAIANPAPQSEDPALLEAQEQEIVQQIEQLYYEGPIVDGHLESYHPSQPQSDVIVYDVRQQVEYVEAVSSSPGKVTCEAPRSAYRLCGVHPSGQNWSYPCPLEQLASVSIAIARYEKLVQLVERRQAITKRLSELTKS